MSKWIEDGDAIPACSQFFANSVELLLAHKETIMNRAEYCLVTSPASFLSFSFIGGGRIPVGVIVSQWADEKMKTRCAVCDGETFIFAIAGSILSGVNQWHGYCRGCQGFALGSSGKIRYEGQKLFGQLQKAGFMNRPNDDAAQSSGFEIDGRRYHLGPTGRPPGEGGDLMQFEDLVRNVERAQDNKTS